MKYKVFHTVVYVNSTILCFFLFTYTTEYMELQRTCDLIFYHMFHASLYSAICNLTAYCTILFDSMSNMQV